MKLWAYTIWDDRRSGLSWEDCAWKSYFRGERISGDLPATDAKVIAFVKKYIAIPRSNYPNHLAPEGWGYLTEARKREIMAHTNRIGIYPERFRVTPGAARPRKHGRKPKGVR